MTILLALSTVFVLLS